MVVQSFLVHFVQQIRNMFPGSLLCYIIESNMSWVDADRTSHFLSRPEFQPCKTISYGAAAQQGKVGVVTTDVTKNLMVDEMRQLLSQGRLVNARYTVCPFDEWAKMQSALSLSARGLDLQDIETKLPSGIRMIADQLYTFQKKIVQPHDVVMGRTRIAYSGKGRNLFDDMVMALMLACTWMRILMEDVSFRREIEVSIGIPLTHWQTQSEIL